MKNTLEEKLEKMVPSAAQQFIKLRDRILALGETVEEKNNKYTVVFRPAGTNIFAECYLHKESIRIQIRNRAYKDTEGWVQCVPDTHLWTLNHFIFVGKDSSIDYAISILKQSMEDVPPPKK